MWRSVMVSVVAAAVLVCTETSSTVSGVDVVQEAERTVVALRLYVRNGSMFVLQDKTESVTRLVVGGDGSWCSDTVNVPTGNACTLTRYENVNGTVGVSSRAFTAASDTLIQW